MIGNFPYLAVALLIGLGIYTLIYKRNLIKIAIGITLIENGVNLFLITLGYRKGAIAPIFTQAPEGLKMVLPTPQALTLTSIVIGVATTALILSVAMIIFKKYGTLDTDEVRRLKE
ncbi:MAG: sodium:proton antiporter [Candidatus Caldatribacteriota bacterium]|jgi:multicomponent Na+:H+ antiporter subunit C|nr:sodium:proton antiporter [Atribacterota bacterium]MDD3031309.1 sodium:proton antiporter [Atribacterota bacterium]MDD3640401.1 sodium:proton antiporter [Atribacterota bacterium]MDD4288193.1 sodium:proton antiporter [Atribacterota bacterium]MDD4764430.1 sodium:proton antiporter [Atribacterota bacterium]